MKKLIVSLILCLCIGGAAYAGLFYKPLPTHQALKDRFDALTDGVNARTSALTTKYGGYGIAFNACANESKDELVMVRAEYLDLWVVLDYFRLYPDEDVADHFDDLYKKYENHADKTIDTIEKCLVAKTSGQKEVLQ